MAAQLEESRGSQRAFLLSISHDLRTPLTSIRGYAEALADGTLDDADPDARRRAATVIGSEARRLERLVQDLLDLSRLDSREFSLHPRPCDAAAVVNDAPPAVRASRCPYRHTDRAQAESSAYMASTSAVASPTMTAVPGSTWRRTMAKPTLPFALVTVPTAFPSASTDAPRATGASARSRR